MRGNSGISPKFPRQDSRSESFPPFSLQRRVPVLHRLVDENDVVPDPLNTVPGDIVFLSPAEQSEKAGRAINDERCRLPVRHMKIHIPHEPPSVLRHAVKVRIKVCGKRKRLIRAAEIFEATGKSIVYWQSKKPLTQSELVKKAELKV